MTTPPALPTLTDDEIFRSSVNADMFPITSVPIARAVEAALHAKLLPYFAQREREAERAAIDAHFVRFIGFPESDTHREWKRVRYPQPTPPPSQEITLSDGWMYRRNAGKWEVKWKKEPCAWVVFSIPPTCLTAADHDKCAELLRMEEQ